MATPDLFLLEVEGMWSSKVELPLFEIIVNPPSILYDLHRLLAVTSKVTGDQDMEEEEEKSEDL